MVLSHGDRNKESIHKRVAYEIKSGAVTIYNGDEAFFLVCNEQDNLSIFSYRSISGTVFEAKGLFMVYKEGRYHYKLQTNDPLTNILVTCHLSRSNSEYIINRKVFNDVVDINCDYDFKEDIWGYSLFPITRNIKLAIHHGIIFDETIYENRRSVYQFLYEE
ncbi:MAG: hypothetical protein NZM04_09540 [Methylacidiphilales bacterium]|nr:hypothetical protein [Candidatus Methylacidiphilales bacterium]